MIDQPNIPGTVHEHPNWRQRISVSLEQIASAIDVDALKAATQCAVHRRFGTVAALPCRIEDYGLIGDCETVGAGRPRRIDRLAMLAGV